VKDVRRKDQVVFALRPEDDVGSAMKFFADKRVLSAPLMDMTTGELFGMVDVVDLLCFVMEQFGPQGDFANEEAWNKIKAMPVAKLVNASRVDTKVKVFDGTPMSVVVALFEKGTQRWGVLSQFDVVKHLLSCDDPRVKAALKVNLSDSLISATVEFGTVLASDNVGAALQQLHVVKVPCVAVMEEKTGKLIGNFSASDLRGFTQPSFSKLSLNVVEYLQKVSPAALKPVIGNKSRTLKELLDMFVSHHIHNVWLLDEACRPQGVISLRNVLEGFVALHIFS